MIAVARTPPLRTSHHAAEAQGCGMPESDSPMIQILLVAALCLLVLLTLLVWGISRRLARIEQRLDEGTVSASHDLSEAPAPTASETATGGPFESFLNEDPARRALTKSEQFAAYRKWRQEKGLNWSGS
jgi:hypothetical protein